MNVPNRQSVTASGTTTKDDPNGLLVFFEEYEVMVDYKQREAAEQLAEIQRLKDELAAMITPLEIRDTARADVWVLAALAREGVFDSLVLEEADRLLVEYDKRFSDPEAGYVDIVFDGPPTTYGVVQSMMNQKGTKAIPGEWLDLKGVGWTLRITPESLRQCL